MAEIRQNGLGGQRPSRNAAQRLSLGTLLGLTCVEASSTGRWVPSLVDTNSPESPRAG